MRCCERPCAWLSCETITTQRHARTLSPGRSIGSSVVVEIGPVSEPVTIYNKSDTDGIKKDAALCHFVAAQPEPLDDDYRQSPLLRGDRLDELVIAPELQE